LNSVGVRSALLDAAGGCFLLETVRKWLGTLSRFINAAGLSNLLRVNYQGRFVVRLVRLNEARLRLVSIEVVGIVEHIRSGHIPVGLFCFYL